MRITIETTDGDDEAKLRRMFNADNAYRALSEIREEVFRPHRKHGYPDSGVQELLNKADEADGTGSKLISALEDRFFEILRECGVDLNDY
jgi:hypothetical protein